MTIAPLTTRNDPQIHTGLMEAVGWTPLLPLRRIAPELAPDVQLLAKAEWFNPGGSVKDRPASFILKDALDQGKLDGGKTLLDSSSGNMGIAYAIFSAAIGITVHLAIPSSAGERKLAILKALGAELTLTDPLEGSDGARDVAAELARTTEGRFHYVNQYSNPANWRSHYETTGPEILEQTDGRLTHFVAGLGTSGSMTGSGRYFRDFDRSIERIAVQPNLPLHGLEGLKHMDSSRIPYIYDPDVPTAQNVVSTEDAYAMTRRLAREEGILAGVSSGAALVAGVQVARELSSGVVVVLFPDSGMNDLELPVWSMSS